MAARLVLVLVVIFTSIAGFLCDNHTYFYRVSAVITNRNFTNDIMKEESADRRNMTVEIQQGLTSIYRLLDNKYKNHHGHLENVTLNNIFFSPPSFQAKKNTSLITKTRPEFNDNEIGVYFLSLVRLDFDVSKPSGSEENVHNIKLLLDGLLFAYYRRQHRPLLGKTLLLNTTTLVTEELPLAGAQKLEDILKHKNNFVSNFVHQEVVSKKDRDILSIISYVGCGFSLVGLAITILTIILSRKLRRLRANQILLQMCISLLGALMFNTFGIRQLKDETLVEPCKAISAFLHYFIVASMIWASIEAYNLYQDLVKVFDTSTLSQTEFMCRVGVVGWVTPGIVVGATLLASSSSYGFHIPDENHKLCWLQIDAFYGALLAPMLLLIAVNMIIFVVVMREIFKMPQAHEKHSKLSQFRATISVFTLLGLNWIFAGLAAATSFIVFQYLFTIFCSFQGFLLFILHGVLKKDFRDSWAQITSKNRVMEMLRSSQSQRTNTSSMGNNSTLPSNSMSFTNPSDVKFNKMAEMDSGIDIHKNDPL